MFVNFGLKLVCTIVIAIAFQVTSIPEETILNIHHFITCCVYLHIDTNSISIYHQQRQADNSQ